MKSIYFLLAILVSVFISSFFALEAKPESAKEQFNQFKSSIDNLYEKSSSPLLLYRDVSKFVAAAYEEHIAKKNFYGNVEKISVSDLSLLFRAAKNVISYTHNDKYIQHMQVVINELENRGHVDEQIYSDFFDALIAVRQFAKARKLTEMQPNIAFKSIPTVRDGEALRQGSPTEYIVDVKNGELVRQNVSLVGSQVFMIAHPSCQFSRQALMDIRSDPKLASLFSSEEAKLIFPQTVGVDIEDMRWLNEHYTDINASIVVNQMEWLEIDYWGLPTFYFFKDGIRMARVIGWPKTGTGRRDEVLSALNLIGLDIPEK